MQPFSFFPDTRAKYRPGVGGLNISMDFNAAPSGTARGTEVIIPNNASPELRAAAARYNQGVAAFAAKHGISDYPIRGVRTRAENGRGVPNTVHTEPFFNSDVAMQEAIKSNPKEFAAIYSAAFQGIPGARAIAPHGIGKDRGAASSIFGDETSFGQFIAKAAAGEDLNGLLDIAAASSGQAPITGGQSQPVAVGGPQQDTLETKPMQQQRSGLFNMTDEQRDRLVLAMSGMSLNPNQGLMAMAQQNMQSRAKEAERTRAAQAQQQKSNQTAQILRQNGAPDFIVQLAEMGRGSEALSMWQKSQAAPEQTSLQKQYAQAVQQGYQGSLMDYQIELKKAGASSTTINTGDQGQRIGTIPQGYTVIEDPSNDAGFRMVPIPGGPEDNTEQQAIADQGTRRSGDVVIEDIDRILGMMNDGGLPITGGVGSVASMVPGTQAHDAGKLLQTVRANVGFDRLQQMRDSSPTGGALGAINQSEMTLLNSALGALEQSQSQEQFRFNLVRLKGIYKEIVHGAQRLGANPSPASSSPQGLSDDDLLKKYGGGQ